METADVDSKGYPELVKAVENWSENDTKNQKEQVDQLYEEALENYKLYKDTETVSYTFHKLENGALTQLDSIPGGIIEKTMHWSGFETYQSRGDYFSYEGKATYAIEDNGFKKI